VSYEVLEASTKISKVKLEMHARIILLARDLKQYVEMTLKLQGVPRKVDVPATYSTHQVKLQEVCKTSQRESSMGCNQQDYMAGTSQDLGNPYHTTLGSGSLTWSFRI
jgi:hypothetical protein